MFKSWTHNPFRKGGSRPCDRNGGLDLKEISLAVVKARERLAAAGTPLVDKSRSPARQANSCMQERDGDRKVQANESFWDF